MNLKMAAKFLDGRPYGEEMTDKVRDIFKRNKIVAIFADSDDGIIFDGAFYDEKSCIGGCSVWFFRNEILGPCPCSVCRILRTENLVKEIKAVWHARDDRATGLAWTFETAISHEKFMILEDDQLWCEGIVFKLDGVPT